MSNAEQVANGLAADGIEIHRHDRIVEKPDSANRLDIRDSYGAVLGTFVIHPHHDAIPAFSRHGLRRLSRCSHA